MTIPEAVSQLRKSERGRAAMAPLAAWIATAAGLDGDNTAAALELMLHAAAGRCGSVLDALRSG